MTIKLIFADILFLAGIGLIGVGCWRINAAAGLIFTGMVGMALAVMLMPARPRTPNDSNKRG